MSVKTLKKEFKYYLAHQDELVKEYNGKILVIKGQEVIGVYDTELEAITETQKNYKLGTFLVQRCEPGEDSYTHLYHSRIAIA